MLALFVVAKTVTLSLTVSVILDTLNKTGSANSVNHLVVSAKIWLLPAPTVRSILFYNEISR